MRKWLWYERLLRFLVIVVLFVGLSYVLPEKLWTQVVDLIKTITPAVLVWWRLPLVIAIAASLYFGIAWRPQPATGLVRTVFRILFGLELLLALTSRFWYANHVVITIAVALVAFITLLIVSKPQDGKERPHADRQKSTKPKFLLDLPIESPDDDRLKRMPLVQALAKGIRDYSHEMPLTVALYGPWGTGKTSVMKFLQTLVEEDGHKSLWVNAWVYDSKPGIWSAFMQALINLLREHHIPAVPNNGLVRYYKAVSKIIQDTELESLSSKAVSSFLENLPTTDDLTELKGEVSKLVQRLVGENRKLVVFIDDLDRCDPESVQGTLEFLKEIADFKQCVFVLGLDRDTTITQLKTKYGAKAEEFLHKVIHLALDLGEPDPDRLVEMFKEQLETLGLIPPDKVESILKRVVMDLQGNPRLIKQFFNRVIVLSDLFTPLLGYEVRPEALIDAEILRLKFPTVYVKLRDTKTVEQLKQKHFSAFHGNSLSATFSQSDEQQEELWVKVVGEVLSISTEDAQVVSGLLTRNLLTGGLFMASDDLALLFSYVEPASVLPSSRVVDILRVIKSHTHRAKDEIFTLFDEEAGAAKLQQFFSKTVNIKNNLLRARAQSHTVSATFEFTDDLLREVIKVGFELQTAIGIQFLPYESLQSLIAGELRHRSPESAVKYLTPLLESDSWELDTVYRLVNSVKTHDQENGVDIPQGLNTVLVQLRRRTFKMFWTQFLADFATKKKTELFSDEGTYYSLLVSSPEIVTDGEAHTEIIDQARQNANSEEWVMNFRHLIRFLADWNRTIGDTRVRELLAKDRQELVGALRVAIDSLNLRSEAKEWFQHDLEWLASGARPM